MSDCVDCAAGHYCPGLGNVDMTPCPAGTWNNETASDRIVLCNKCTYNTYSDVLGATDESTCTACPEARPYSLEGTVSASDCSATPVICSEGHFCEPPTYEEKDCPAGTFMDKTYAISIADCKPCPAGSFTAKTGQSYCKACAPGYVQTQLGLSMLCRHVLFDC